MIDFNIYKDGKRHALTMSYDDCAIHDRKLVEIFNKYGIRGTFNLISGRFDDENTIRSDEIAQLYANHEVAVHTVHHPWLEKMPTTSVISEILDDRKNIEKCCGYPVRGMAYPFGTYSDQVISAAKSCGIVYSRTAGESWSFGQPQDFMKWTGSCHHNNCLKLAERFLQSIESKWFAGLFYVWGHSYEFHNANNWELIEEFCQKVSNNPLIWYATNIEIYDYITAQRALQISVDESIIHNPTAIDVWIKKDEVPVKIPAGTTVTL